MRFKWLSVPVALILVGAAVYGALALTALSAPSHPFFSGEIAEHEVIAHRGGAHLRPENTLEAFLHAAETGADVLDMDVRRTADGAIVCMHDSTVDRTTEGTGRVASFGLDDLQRLDAGYRWSRDGGTTFPFRGRGIRVPALEEVFARVPRMRMVIEMKDADSEFAKSLCALIRRAGMSAKSLVASFNAEAMNEFRTACPEIATSMGAPEARVFVALSRARLAGVYSPPAPAFQVPDRLGDTVIATAQLVADAHRRNVKVHVWTVNDEERVRQLLRIGVDGIITDRPDVMLRVRAEARR